MEETIVVDCGHCGGSGSCNCPVCLREHDMSHQGSAVPCTKCDGTGKRILRD